MDEYPPEEVTYQYPDPDDVAYRTRFSWAGDDNDYIPAALQPQFLGSWHDTEADSGDNVHHSRGEWPSHEYEVSADRGLELATDAEYENLEHSERRVL